RAYRPDVREDAVPESRLVEVVDARRAAGAGPPSDDSLDHASVTLAEDDERLLERDELVEDHARPREERQLAVALDEDDRRPDARRPLPLLLRHVVRLEERARRVDLLLVTCVEPLDVGGRQSL